MGTPRRLFAVLVLVVFAAAATVAAQSADWLQWGRTPQHDGASPVTAQPLEGILGAIGYDPFVADMLDQRPVLLVHYAVPLVDSEGVYMAFKTGEYQGFGAWDSITWTVRKLRLTDAGFETVWTFVSDWKPAPLELTVWEAVFQPAISGHDIYVPGLGGTVFRVDKDTGISEGRVNPFTGLDPNRYVAGGLAVAPDGAVIYNVIGLPSSEPRLSTTGAWLVRVEHEGAASRVDFATLVSGAPAADDPCQVSFSPDLRPWPPSPTAVPPTVPCGAQRPGINVIPAIAPDGTIYTLSRAHVVDRYSYLVAVHPDLTPAWHASLRGHLNDGCGVLIPIDDTNSGCRTGASIGVDPAVNDRPAGRVSDLGTSSPVVLPDGSVLIGTTSSYNYGRGHLFKFSAAGDALATYDFGWDITPAVFRHDGTYSIVVKDNHYAGPPGPTGVYEITSLDASLEAQWSLPSTTTDTCFRLPSGAMDCYGIPRHPDGFEWCINQPAIDAAGIAFGNSEDGNLYSLERDGRRRQVLFLDAALGAAYTPVAIGPDGVVYAQNFGRLFAVGSAPVVTAPREPPAPVPEARPGAPTVVR
jgi:hypothetical protein